MLLNTSPLAWSVMEAMRVGEAQDNTPTMPEPKSPKRDVYSEVVEFEEQEALRRSPEEDAALFHDTCSEIGRMMVEILVLKQKKTAQTVAEINEKRIEVSLLFVTLKKLNRLEKLRLKQARDTTEKMKQKVNCFHTQLQNMLYELMHLQKEISKCQAFKSKDEEIDLVQVEKFYMMAPEEISRPVVTRKNPHQLKLARLEWELEQRKQLAVKYKKLEECKESVAKVVQEKQEYLENLNPKLNTLLENVKFLQESWERPLSKNFLQLALVKHLPRVLYTLFAQGSAYQDICDKFLEVSVEGDLEKVKAEQKSLMDQMEADGEGEESNSEIESDTDEEDIRKMCNRKKSQLDCLEEKRKKLLAKHPLCVRFIIKIEDGSSITLNFYYLVNLHIVTVKCEINLSQPIHDNIIKVLLFPESVLCCLFPHDFGEESPNSANAFQLQRVGIFHFREHMDDTGVPYIWAQKMVGVDFLRADLVTSYSSQMEVDVDEEAGEEEKGRRVATSLRPDSGLSLNHLESVIRAIRRRLRARVALAKQIEAFGMRSNSSNDSNSSKMFWSSPLQTESADVKTNYIDESMEVKTDYKNVSMKMDYTDESMEMQEDSTDESVEMKYMRLLCYLFHMPRFNHTVQKVLEKRETPKEQNCKPTKKAHDLMANLESADGCSRAKAAVFFDIYSHLNDLIQSNPECIDPEKGMYAADYNLLLPVVNKVFKRDEEARILQQYNTKTIVKGMFGMLMGGENEEKEMKVKKEEAKEEEEKEEKQEAKQKHPKKNDSFSLTSSLGYLADSMIDTGISNLGLLVDHLLITLYNLYSMARCEAKLKIPSQVRDPCNKKILENKVSSFKDKLTRNVPNLVLKVHQLHSDGLLQGENLDRVIETAISAHKKKKQVPFRQSSSISYMLRQLINDIIQRGYQVSADRICPMISAVGDDSITIDCLK